MAEQQPHNQKVMVNCSVKMVERMDKLRSHVAQGSLRGTAHRSDVVRKALDIGLGVIEAEAAAQES